MKISFEVGKLDLLKEINSTRHEIGGDQGDLNQVLDVHNLILHQLEVVLEDF